MKWMRQPFCPHALVSFIYGRITKANKNNELTMVLLPQLLSNSNVSMEKAK